MSTHTRRGFTIIEVMLFLAISGALTVGILVGSGVAINRQRYQDSVNSFKSTIQEQYSQVTNVVNGDQNNPACEMSNGTLVLTGGSQARGTSECVVIGRFLLIESTQTIAYKLIGRAPGGATKQDEGDTELLAKYAFTVQSPESREISWGAQIVKPETVDGATVDATAGVLVVRSPISGTILTYVTDLEGLDLSSLPEEDRVPAVVRYVGTMINDRNIQQKDFCVDSDGGLSALAKRRAVRIMAGAANPSAVEIARESDDICKA